MIMKRLPVHAETTPTQEQKNKWGANAEAVLMGFTVEMSSEQEVEFVLGRINEVLTTSLNVSLDPKEVMRLATQYTKNAVFRYMNLVTLDDMIMIALPMDTDEGKIPVNLETPEGIFAYVYNATYPDCSELGYVFFQKKNGIYKRVG